MADIAKKQNNAKKPVGITETILRDAHQSLIATRMTTEQMLPIVEKMDQVGYHSVECWGGATFDASLRFLKEDPWERLRKFRAGFKNTKLKLSDNEKKMSQGWQIFFDTIAIQERKNEKLQQQLLPLKYRPYQTEHLKKEEKCALFSK